MDSYDSYPTASLDNSIPFRDGFLPTLTVRAREQDPTGADSELGLELRNMRARAAP